MFNRMRNKAKTNSGIFAIGKKDYFCQPIEKRKIIILLS